MVIAAFSAARMTMDAPAVAVTTFGPRPSTTGCLARPAGAGGRRS